MNTAVAVWRLGPWFQMEVLAAVVFSTEMNSTRSHIPSLLPTSFLMPTVCRSLPSPYLCPVLHSQKSAICGFSTISQSPIFADGLLKDQLSDLGKLLYPCLVLLSQSLNPTRGKRHEITAALSKCSTTGEGDTSACQTNKEKALLVILCT